MPKVESIYDIPEELRNLEKTKEEKSKKFHFYFGDYIEYTVGIYYCLDNKRIEDIMKGDDNFWKEKLKIMEELGLKEPDTVTKTGRRIFGKVTPAGEKIKREVAEICSELERDSKVMDIVNYALQGIYINIHTYLFSGGRFDFSKFGINDKEWDIVKLNLNLYLYFCYKGYAYIERYSFYFSEEAYKKGEELFKSWFKKNRASLKENVRKIFEETPRLANQILKELLNLPEDKLPEVFDISWSDPHENVKIEFSINSKYPMVSQSDKEEIKFSILVGEDIYNLGNRITPNSINDLFYSLGKLEIGSYYYSRSRRGYEYYRFITTKHVLLFLKEILKECDFDYTPVTLSDLEYDDREKAYEYLALKEIKELMEKRGGETENEELNMKEIFDKYNVREKISEVLKDMAEKGIIDALDLERYDFNIPDGWKYYGYIDKTLEEPVIEKLKSLKMIKNRKTSFYDIKLTKNSKGDLLCWNPLEESNWHLAIIGSENEKEKVIQSVNELVSKLESVTTKPSVLTIVFREEYKDNGILCMLHPGNVDDIVKTLDTENKVVLQFADTVTSKEANDFLNKLFKLEKLKEKTGYPKMYIINTPGDKKGETSWSILKDTDTLKRFMENCASHGIGCIYVSTDQNELNLERAKNLNIPIIVVDSDKKEFISSINKN